MLALMLTAGGAATGIALTTGANARPRALRSLYGQVVAVSGPGTTVTFDPATGTTAGYKVRGAAPFTPVAVSPDGTTWLGSGGALAVVDNGRASSRPSPLPADESSTTTAADQPFAEGSRAVVLESRPTAASPAQASIVRLADGQRFPLGIVDRAAGDPQSLGAFVSIPVDGRQPRVAQPAVADRDVELLRPGHPPRVLATAGQLEADAGWLPTRAVQLEVYPSPTGDAVAVVLTPLDPIEGDVPLVVLDRQGGVIAALDDWRGPMYGTRPVWSPGAHQLAYPTYTTTGPALAIGSETGAIGTVTAPAGTEFGACVWSVSSTDVVCQARTGGRYEWLYAVPSSEHLLATASPGVPVAWIAGPAR